MHDWRAEIRARLSAVSIAPAHEADLVEELAQHLEQDFNALRARGTTDDEAWHILVVQLTAEALGDAVQSWQRAHPSPALIPVGAQSTKRRWLDGAWQDVRYGWRALRRSPVFTGVAVLSLALGIGANTAIFGLLHAVLLERLAVPRPDQLVVLKRTSGKGLLDRFAYAEYLALKQAPGLPRIEAWTGATVTVVVRNARDYPGANLVSGGFFDMVGVRPLLGRAISPEDERASAPVAVVSQDFWEQHLDADPSAPGQTITINDQPFAVVGVLPRSYRGMMFAGTFTMAVPLTTASLLGLPDLHSARGVPVALFARLSPGMSAERSGTMFDLAFQRCCVTVQLPGAPRAIKRNPGAREEPTPQQHLVVADASRGVSNPKYDLRSEYRRVLFALMAGVIVLLLIACANVGNLLLARAAARQRELAVRMSIGATRSRVVQQLLTESVELALLGGVLGVVLARWGTTLLSHNLPTAATNLADMIALRPSPAILAFTAIVTLGCTLLFGVFPAIRATRNDIMSPLKDGGRGSSGSARLVVDRGVVVAQVALALVLVCAAMLFVATLRNLKQFDGGYRSTNVLLAQIETRWTIYESRGMVPLYEEMLERVRHLPGIEVAAMSSTLPVFGGRSSRDLIRVPGYDAPSDEDSNAWFAAVTPNFFAATGISLARGREFDARDGAAGEKVAIVSQAFAHHYFAGRDPIGGTIIIGDEPHATQMRVVGVAHDARYEGLRSPPTEIYYAPLAQSGNWPFLVLAARTAADPLTSGSAVRNQVAAVAPGIRTLRLVGVEQALDEQLAPERLAAALATLFGMLALGLAAVGLYGVVAYNVSGRTQEIGVRMALGARPADVLWLIVRQTLTMTGIGVAIGVPLALVAARSIAAQLYGVGANDPRVMIGAAALLVFVGAAASVLPSKRAASVNPVEALRAE